MTRGDLYGSYCLCVPLYRQDTVHVGFTERLTTFHAADVVKLDGGCGVVNGGGGGGRGGL